jgi:DNA uptake protein ComE-like DNA-binding protein
MWKDFFYFSRQQRRGIIVLIVLIGIVIGCNIMLKMYIRRLETPANNPEKMREYELFVQSLKEKEREEDQSDSRAYQPTQTLRPFPFDPNQIDSVTFVRLGLPRWMARNLIRYRQKGGKFRKPEDFKKLYGLKPEQFEQLAPYIIINEPPTSPPPRQTVSLLIDTMARTKRDSILYQPKYSEGTTLDLNQADTTELKMIPGVGSYIARRIVQYRSKLGGYYSVEQLSEINLRADLLKKWFTLQTKDIRPLNLNRSGIERLNAHPYLNFYQAKVIVEYKKKRGKLKSLQELSLYEEFTKEDMERLAYYVAFE